MAGGGIGLGPSSSSALPSSSSSTSASAASPTALSWFPSASAVGQVAVSEVRLLFRSPESLQRLDVHRAEFAAKREEARQLLSQAIAAQVEDTKQGVQLLQQAVRHSPSPQPTRAGRG